MEFEAKRDDGLIHTFDVTTQILIGSYCGKQDIHYKDTGNDPTPGDKRCEECDKIAQSLRANDMSCTCQECGCKYSVDLSVPDRIWVQISPKKNEAGMLCPTCICNAVAKLKVGDIPARIHGVIKQGGAS